MVLGQMSLVQTPSTYYNSPHLLPPLIIPPLLLYKLPNYYLFLSSVVKAAVLAGPWVPYLLP